MLRAHRGTSAPHPERSSGPPLLAVLNDLSVCITVLLILFNSGSFGYRRVSGSGNAIFLFHMFSDILSCGSLWHSSSLLNVCRGRVGVTRGK